MGFEACFFDLDDTLYPELDFVRSGFRAVARFVESQTGLPSERTQKMLLESLNRDGRGRVFDALIDDCRLGSHFSTATLVYIYRTHAPRLELPNESCIVLKNLREQGQKLAVITDGMGSVQRRKIDSLRLTDHVDLCLATDELGAAAWKPSPDAFRVACEILSVDPVRSCYVGDNPKKDFEGANRIGMQTIRLRSASCALRDEPDSPTPHAAPGRHIKTLTELVHSHD